MNWKNLEDIESVEMIPGYHGKMVHSDKMTIIFWTAEKDAVAPEHSHVHEQIMHLVEGEFQFTVDGVTKNLSAGAVVTLPSNIVHSGKALTPCKIIDIFHPVREDFWKAKK